MSVILHALLFASTANAQDLVFDPVDDLALGDPGSGHEDDTSEVYGGHPVQEGMWKDTVALLDHRGENFCSGTLIAPTVVLTAAHCVDDGVTPTSVVIASESLDGGEHIDVTRAVAYPNWLRSYDIAVLTLAKPSTLASPRTIASGCVLDQHLYDGAEVAIVGYGVTETDDWNQLKNVAETQVVDHDCSDVDAWDCARPVSPGGEVMAGGHGIDSCFGDSGGPLYLRTEIGDFLVGVTSRGAIWEPDCGGGGIYVRPDAVLEWIETTAGTTLPDPVCDEGGGGPADSGEAGGDDGDCDEGGYYTVIPYEFGCSTVGTSGLAGFALPALLLLGLRRRE